MEDQTLNYKSGKAEDPRSPSGGGPILPIGVELVHAISELDPEVNKSAPSNPDWQKTIIEVMLRYLVHLGVNESLLQSGKIADETNPNINKEYFFAGSYLLKQDDDIVYEDLIPSDGIFQSVVIGKKSKLPGNFPEVNEK